MRIKTMLFALVAVSLLVSPVLAGTKPAPKRMDIDSVMQLNSHMQNPASRAVEGFEGGVIPAGWTVDGTTAGDRVWGVSGALSSGAAEGMYAAFIGYDSVNSQNETLSFDAALSAGNDQLSFYMLGSVGHDWTYFVTETVEITHAGGTTLVFDFDSSVTAEAYEWARYDVDLSAWNGETVTVTFRYEGIDGDLHALDAVAIDDGTGYVYVAPEAPENDTCEGAIAIAPGAFSIQGDNTLANHDYDTDGSCTGYSASGNDVVYTVGLASGQAFNVTMTTSGWDDSIFLVTDCADS